ncbi:hypothetical protein N7539_006061 [Penicillium diatomitis]|uniref:CHL4 family chromosome segregation protein n=1 Tax=Penicillium diatomitis TaxID=2819901 RepID=A0A9W9X4Z8_9EURO|nr:uncharacterized protein N7539_006061 [Penicillium diatomitis]KAJ5483861.1 hypothetical protein N7539_006061 [Penicillium diatomitis]
MARSKLIRAPTTASLPNNLRIPPTTPSLTKALGKHSRQALIELALTWLDDQHLASFPPYLQSDARHDKDNEEALPYPAADTVEDARQAYMDFQDRKGAKREVLERILEGDWRHGITLRQLAMADLRYLDDHPTSLRWTALELSRIDTRRGISNDAPMADWSASIPRTQVATFVKALQQEISPLVKAHYHLSRSSTLPLTFLRIFVLDTPYQTPRQSSEIFADSSRIIYVAFPDSCPYVYTSISTSPGSKANPSSNSAGTDSRSLLRIVRDAVPKALSRPHERYTLKATALAAKNLPTLLALRGPGRTTAANGAFCIFADAAVEGSPLDPRPSNTVSAEEYIRADSGVFTTDDKENVDIASASKAMPKRDADLATPRDLSPQTSKKRRLATLSRFGCAEISSNPAPLDRLDVRLLDGPSNTKRTDDNVTEIADSGSATLPTVTLTFNGSDVVGGLRKLAELGIIDPERMPSWMTGEEAVSTAVVKGGKRLRNHV